MEKETHRFFNSIIAQSYIWQKVGPHFVPGHVSSRRLSVPDPLTFPKSKVHNWHVYFIKSKKGFFLHLWTDTQDGGPSEKYVFLNWCWQTQTSSAIWQKNHLGFLAPSRMGVDAANFPRWLILCHQHIDITNKYSRNRYCVCLEIRCIHTDFRNLSLFLNDSWDINKNT